MLTKKHEQKSTIMAGKFNHITEILQLPYNVKYYAFFYKNLYFYYYFLKFLTDYCYRSYNLTLDTYKYFLL